MDQSKTCDRSIKIWVNVRSIALSMVDKLWRGPYYLPFSLSIWLGITQCFLFLYLILFFLFTFFCCSVFSAPSFPKQNDLIWIDSQFWYLTSYIVLRSVNAIVLKEVYNLYKSIYSQYAMYYNWPMLRMSDSHGIEPKTALLQVVSKVAANANTIWL